MSLSSDDLQKIADVVRAALHPSIRAEDFTSSHTDRRGPPLPASQAAVAPRPPEATAADPIGGALDQLKAARRAIEAATPSTVKG